MKLSGIFHPYAHCSVNLEGLNDPAIIPSQCPIYFTIIEDLRKGCGI